MSDSRRATVDVDVLMTIGMSLLLAGLALIGLRSSYGGSEFFVVGMAGAVLGVAVAVAGRRFGLGLWVSMIVALAVYCVIGGVIALPDRAGGGRLPSVDTIQLSIERAVAGWKELITIAPPVGRTADLMVLPMAAGFWSGFASTSLAQRLKSIWLVVVPATVVFALSIATGVDQPVALLVQGAVLGASAVAWMAWREHRNRPILGSTGAERTRFAMAAALLVTALAGGHVAGSRLPFVSGERDIWRTTVTPPFDPRTQPSPLAGYRTYVKEAGRASGEDPVMFTIEGVPADLPVRLATMDEFDGLVWQVSAGAPDNPSLKTSGAFVQVGASTEPDFAGPTANVTVVIDEYADVWIPTVGEVISLRFDGSTAGQDRDRQLTDAFRYNRATDTGAMNLRLQAGDRYLMQVQLPTTMDTLSGETISPEVPALGASVDVPEISRRLIPQDLLAIDDVGARLDYIRDEMTANGVYSDGDDIENHLRSEAGHSAFRLTGFVARYPDEQLVGNAEQYASTFAVLFRGLGRVPTRVVMGFQPSEDSTTGPVEVHASEVEAWVEVPVDTTGWVAIFPTPARDKLNRTGVQAQEPEPEYRTQSPPPPPLIDPEFDRPATAQGESTATEEEAAPEAAEPDESLSITVTPLLVAAALAVGSVIVALLVGFVTAMLKRRRKRRRRTRGTPDERIAAGWHEVTDLAVDMGYPLPAATTRRELAGVVGGSSIALAERTDTAVWGPDRPSDDEVEQFWVDVEEHLAKERRANGFIGRVRSDISTRSFQRAGRRAPPSDIIRDEIEEEHNAAERNHLQDANELTITTHTTVDEAIESVSEIAERRGYLCVRSGPSTFRLARSRRPGWAIVLAVVLFPMLGLGLLFLRIRRSDSAVVSAYDDPRGGRLHLIGPTDATLIEEFRKLDAATIFEALADVEEAEQPPPTSGARAEHGEDEHSDPAEPKTRLAPSPSGTADGSADEATAPDVATGADEVRTRIAPAEAPGIEPPDGATVMRPDTQARRLSAPTVRMPNGETLDVSAGVVIGRDPAPSPPFHLFAQWKTDNQTVSRTQVALATDGRSVRVTDLGSTNGTVVVRDGVENPCEPLTPTTAEIGDEIRIGDLVLKVETRAD